MVGKMKDGRWYSSFYFTDWTGLRKKKKKEGFTTQKEAKEFERKFLENYTNNPNISFETLFNKYLEDRKVNVKESTYINRLPAYNKHILPYFKNKVISEITVNDVREWQNEIKKIKRNDKPYSASYIRCLNNYLIAIFNFGVRFFKLKENPASNIKAMGKRTKSTQYWTLEEFKKFDETVKDSRIKITVKILFFTGMRIGELQALNLKYIDLENKIIKVRHTLQRVNKKDVITPPKTEGSIRDIAINESLCNDIKEFLDKSYNDDYPFYNSKYRLYYQFKKTTKEAGLKEIRIHDLRHSHASLLINLNIAPLAISKRLGHDSIKTTMDIYGHLYPTNNEYITKKLNELY